MARGPLPRGPDLDWIHLWLRRVVQRVVRIRRDRAVGGTEAGHGLEKKRHFLKRLERNLGALSAVDSHVHLSLCRMLTSNVIPRRPTSQGDGGGFFFLNFREARGRKKPRTN